MLKYLIILLILLPTSALAWTSDIDCYYYNHEEHFRNVDWTIEAGGSTIRIWTKDGQMYMGISNCIITEKP